MIFMRLKIICRENIIRRPMDGGIFILIDKRKMKNDRIAVYPSSHKGSGLPG